MSQETRTDTQFDYYAVLGVPRDATIAEIRAAYQVLNQNGQATAGHTDEIERAYAALSDPDRRLIYNQMTSKSHKVIYCPFCSDYDPDAWHTAWNGNASLTIEGVHATVFMYKTGWRAGNWGYVIGKGGFWQGEPFATEAEARLAAKAMAARAMYQCCPQ